GFRYPLPLRMVPIEVDPPAAVAGASNLALELDGENGWVEVPSAAIAFEGAMTLECRFRAKAFGERTGLIAKTESSDYGLYVSHGRLIFSIFLGNQYVTVESPSPVLVADQWHHVAAVCDGAEVRLYLDGEMIA